MSSKNVLLAILIVCVCAAVIAVHWPALSARDTSFTTHLSKIQVSFLPGSSFLRFLNRQR